MTSFKVSGRNSGRKTLPEVNTKCAECGFDITVDAQFCPHCHAPIVRRYCPGCSKLVPENTELCPYCGTSAKARLRQPENIPTIVAIGVLIAVLTLLIFRPSAPYGDRATTLPPEIYHRAVSVQQAVLTQSDSQPRNEVKLISIAPPAENGEKLNLLGHGLIQQRRYDEAVPVLKRAVASFSPNSADLTYKFALYNLGHALRRSGNPTQAISYFEKVLAIDGDWTKALDELALARAQAATSRQLEVNEPASYSNRR